MAIKLGLMLGTHGAASDIAADQRRSKSGFQRQKHGSERLAKKCAMIRNDTPVRQSCRECSGSRQRRTDGSPVIPDNFRWISTMAAMAAQRSKIELMDTVVKTMDDIAHECASGIRDDP